MMRGAALSVLIAATASSALAGNSPQISAGQGLAQRLCGGCHAVGAGASPLADAPPFPTLYRHYRPGCLEIALSAGMLAPQRQPEEGGVRRHPRMPLTTLDDEQRASLTAYLRSLDPRATPAIPACPSPPPVP